MKELSLHILDLSENSVKAKAHSICITVREDFIIDKLLIQIEDDGVGMNKDFLERADNPFSTTRETRNVGLGLSLVKSAAQRCNGTFEIESVEGKGTKVSFSFQHSHIDRAPLGNMGETISIITNFSSEIDIIYRHYVNNKEFIYSTIDIKRVLNENDIRKTDILLWIIDYVNEGIKELYVKNIT